ncbi:hypothetical protein EVAR_12068_1 [Eumeta japonica]|uniref:Uncharacterized protein n=1 Tax=Eumeta variegata TaxID=151549 RepID=A0A4C1U5S2_EUMVA|nr:hypothetical protein EVAR_12068_1 [Eumeta japonica]
MVDVSHSRDTNIFESNIDADGDSVVGTSNEEPSNDSHLEYDSSKESYDEQSEGEKVNKEESLTENFTTNRLKRSGKSKSTSSSRSKRYRCTNECISDENEGRLETVNVATQTDAILKCNQSQNSESRETNSASEFGSYSDQSFDNLPFGITLVYKTRRDRIPSRVIMASLNPKLLSELESRNSQ